MHTFCKISLTLAIFGSTLIPSALAMPIPGFLGFLTPTSNGGLEKVDPKDSVLPRQSCGALVSGGSDEDYRRNEACRWETTNGRLSGRDINDRQVMQSSASMVGTAESASSEVQSRHEDEMLQAIDEAQDN